MLLFHITIVHHYCKYHLIIIIEKHINMQRIAYEIKSLSYYISNNFYITLVF